jgi:glycosyltransferase involved in cell wall biosynthesis
MKLLLELRPALDGHAGIPQETRLLFAGLAGLPGLQVQGLIQSSSLPIDRGLPLRDGRIEGSIAPDERIDRLSKVVVSLQPAAGVNALENLRRRLRRYGGPLRAAAGSMVGLREPLSGFDATHFKDFVWRAMFAKTLPLSDFDTVTGCDFRILGLPYGVTFALGALTGFFGHAVFPRIDTRGADILLAETPYPGIPSRGTRLVVRYHDAVPLLMPHTIKNRAQHRAAHFHALRRNARDGAWFACVSDATRADLLSVLPQLEPRAVTIPNMVLERPESEIGAAARVPEIIWSRKNRAAPEGGGAALPPSVADSGALDYLLMVSTLEPRKNHAALLDAWEALRGSSHPGLHLVCVGGLGWQHEDIIGRFRPWLARGGLHLLNDVPSADLRTLYRHARATVCPSFMEGFDYSGVEAMQCGGAVVASDIRVHRDVFGGAAEYFNPYAAPELAAALERVIGPAGADRRAALVAEGAAVAARYRPQVVLPQWQAFLERVAAGGAGRPVSAG